MPRAKKETPTTKKNNGNTATSTLTAKDKTGTKSEPKALIDYFQKQKEWYESQGPNIFVLYQIGAFYEYYAKVVYCGERKTDTEPDSILDCEMKYNRESSFSTFLDLTEFKLMDKKIVLDGFPILGAGFRDYQLEIYLTKLTESGYTVVVYSQKDTKKDGLQERFLDGVYSPGTFLPCGGLLGNSGLENTVGKMDKSIHNKKSNHMMCIWVEILRFKTCGYKWYMGVSVMDVYSGHSSLFEYEKPIEKMGGSDEFIYTPSLIDELERYVYTHQPSELILIGQSKTLDAVEEFVGLKGVLKHRIEIDALSPSLLISDGVTVGSISSSYSGVSAMEKANRCTKQKYIHDLLIKVFGEKSMAQCSEFDMYLYATRSFCYLIHFIGEHRSELISHLSLPEFHNTSNRVVLANHTLQQLNILDVEEAKGYGVNAVENRYHSVAGFLNRCKTPMGQRLIQSQIVRPTFDEIWLEKEYEMTEWLLSVSRGGEDCISFLRTSLSGMRDLEKMGRQLLMAKLCPGNLYHLYLSLENILNIETHLSKIMDKKAIEYFSYQKAKCFFPVSSKMKTDTEVGMRTLLQNLLKYIRFSVDLDACKGAISMTSFDKPVVIDSEISEIMGQIEKGEQLFEQTCKNLNNLLGQSDWVKWRTTDKGTMTLEMTKIRGGLLEAKIAEQLDTDLLVIDVSKQWLNTLKIKAERGDSTVVVSNPELLEASSKNVVLREKMSDHSSKLYAKFLHDLSSQWHEVISWYGKYTARIDALQCKAFVAREYYYCRPTIFRCRKPSSDSECERVSPLTTESSYPLLNLDLGNRLDGSESESEEDRGSGIIAKGLRHVLIEHLQQHEIYIANDVAIGSGHENISERGWLIYGTNAVGKTSLIRALGITTIMAQAGFYVPCSSFSFRPYTSIYSRILGNDNLFKGMSTFEVEMSELRVILRESGPRSMILGDELCSGTEMESAMSIFVASLEHLVRKGGSFLFATHFHEIAYYEEIEKLKNMGGLALKHLTVHFDAKTGKLVYDRRIKDGPGTALYGLEVCRSLYLPEDFIERAYEIRRLHSHLGGNGELGSLEAKPSSYNAKKLRGICENCGQARGEEVHHIVPQHKANAKGFIVSEETGGVFHKNHLANLKNLCHKCHSSIHHPSSVY